MKTTIIISEQHTLLPEQEELLKEKFGTWQTILVPATGWTREEREIICDTLRGNVVFVSPIPVSPIPGMILYLAVRASFEFCNKWPKTVRPWVFSNDTREKKELPGGKVVSVTAKTGWYLE